MAFNRTLLRNISKEDFSDLLVYPETITDKYFEYLLNREKERQNLIIRWEDQMQIFENLAKSFVDFDLISATLLYKNNLKH